MMDNNILEQNNVLLTVFKKPSINATSFKISMDWIRALMTRFVFVPIPDHVMLLCQFHMQECDYFWKMKIKEQSSTQKAKQGPLSGLSRL